jgi:quercetin dioxygenase-like cupin family protein
MELVELKHFKFDKIDAKDVLDFGSKGTTIRVFISESEAPNFIMRRFEIQPGGIIGIHSHEWEHEMYILQGELFLIDDKGKKEKVSKDEFVYMPPNEPHGYLNESEETAVFLCIIPKKK